MLTAAGGVYIPTEPKVLFGGFAYPVPDRVRCRRHFPAILPPQAEILSGFICKTARFGQSWDGKTPMKTEALQEVVWVNLAPGILPSV